MPRFSRKSKRRETGSEGIVGHLLTGHCLMCLLDPDNHSDEQLQAEWSKQRDTLLPEFVKANPGTRPWAWWKWDAPEPRRRERIDGGVHPHDNKERTLKVANSNSDFLWRVAYHLWFGLPNSHISPFDRGIKTEMFEPEWSFLVRHNLLLPEDSP